MNTKSELIIKPEYPKLMIAPKGAVVMYTSWAEGVVLHTTENSGWSVGESVRHNYPDMEIYKGVLRLWN